MDLGNLCTCEDELLRRKNKWYQSDNIGAEFMSMSVLHECRVYLQIRSCLSKSVSCGAVLGLKLLVLK